MFGWLRWFFVSLTCQCITTEWAVDDHGVTRCTVCHRRMTVEDREQWW